MCGFVAGLYQTCNQPLPSTANDRNDNGCYFILSGCRHVDR